MAFYLGAVQVTPVPTSDANSRGSKLISNGSDGTNWGYMGSGFTGFTPDNAQWLYRSIFTHGYLAGGYKGSTPWRSVNKTWHQTDTTVYCGNSYQTIVLIQMVFGVIITHISVQLMDILTHMIKYVLTV